MRLKKIGLALLFGLFAAMASAQPLLLDRIVAVINNEVVLLSELEREMDTVRGAMQMNQMTVPPRPVFEKQVLERLILKRLQLDWAETTGIRIDDAQLNQALVEIASSNNMTLTALAQVIESDGVPYADFRERIRADMILAQLQRRFGESAVTVSQSEINNYLTNLRMTDQGAQIQYQLAHILIPFNESASVAEIKEAADTAHLVLNKAKAGEDFSALAMEHSAAPTALEGGLLDWRTLNQLPSLFTGVVPGMLVGDVAGPLRNPGGFHLVKLVERRETGRNVIEQTNASHILVLSSALVSDQDAREQLEKYRDKVLAGTDTFEDLAKAHSQDQASAIDGGALGWVSPGVFVPEFEKVLSVMQDKGELSPVFKSRFGWHLIRLNERRQHDNTEEMLRAKAEEEIRRRKTEEEFDVWLRRQREEAFIETRM